MHKRSNVRVSVRGTNAVIQASVPACGFGYGCFQVTGTEDLGGFGKATFRNALGKENGGAFAVKEMVFPTLPPTPVAQKSTLSAVVIDLRGEKHELSDVRVAGNILTFERSGSVLTVKLPDVRRLELHSEVPSDNPHPLAPSGIT